MDLTPHGCPLRRRDPCVCANLCSAATEDVAASVGTTATQPPPPAKLPLPRAKTEAAEVNQRQWGTSTPSAPAARQRKRDALKQLLRHAIFGRPNGTRAVVSAWLMSVITSPPPPAAPQPAAAAEGTTATRTPGEGSGSTPARATQTQAPPAATLDLPLAKLNAAKQNAAQWGIGGAQAAALTLPEIEAKEKALQDMLFPLEDSSSVGAGGGAGHWQAPHTERQARAAAAASSKQGRRAGGAAGRWAESVTLGADKARPNLRQAQPRMIVTPTRTLRKQ